MRKRILFVDDDPGILGALERVLRRDRMRWEMVFVVGGRQALDELNRGRFDAVVSDMQMPDVDGVTLLRVIERDSPATGRILLTGHVDELALQRVRPTLHQLLNKPCDATVLRAAIEHQLAVRHGEGAFSP